jgi:hypothetical protein
MLLVDRLLQGFCFDFSDRACFGQVTDQLHYLIGLIGVSWPLLALGLLGLSKAQERPFPICASRLGLLFTPWFKFWHLVLDIFSREQNDLIVGKGKLGQLFEKIKERLLERV